MTQCAQCGHTLGIGRFCVNCGHPVSGAAGPSGPPPSGPPPSAPPPAGPPPSGPPPASPPTVVAPPPAYETPAPVRYPLFADDSGQSLPIVSEATTSTPAPPTRTDRGPGRLPWILAIVAVVAIALLGAFLVFTGNDDDPSADREAPAPTGAVSEPTSGATESSTAPTTSTTPPPPRDDGKPGNRARFATAVVPATARPSQDVQGRSVRYEAFNMLDGEPDTTWRMPGNGKGADIVFDLGQDTEITEVGLINGYTKNADGYDAYPANRRIRRVLWRFDDGTEIIQKFVDGDRKMQKQPIPKTVTSTVRLRILNVTSKARGPSGRDYTAISEVLLYGQPV